MSNAAATNFDSLLVEKMIIYKITENEEEIKNKTTSLIANAKLTNRPLGLITDIKHRINIINMELFPVLNIRFFFPNKNKLNPN